MSLWLRLGPLGVSSRGRAGVRMGPFSAYGGGRRRRSRHGRTQQPVVKGFRDWRTSLVTWLGAALAIFFVAIHFWYVGVLVVCVLLIWYVRGAPNRAVRHERWLAGPAPPLPLPSRFTQNWIAVNVPHLHPRQLETMLAEMRARGWTEADIQRRVSPHLPSYGRSRRSHSQAPNTRPKARQPRFVPHISDPVGAAKEAYAGGRITLEEFEAIAAEHPEG